MARNTAKQDTVRYTTVLPVSCINKLKEMARESKIPSVNQGIRIAVEEFIQAQKKLSYEEKMREAAKDKDFMERLAETQDAFY